MELKVDVPGIGARTIALTPEQEKQFREASESNQGDVNFSVRSLEKKVDLKEDWPPLDFMDGMLEKGELALTYPRSSGKPSGLSPKDLAVEHTALHCVQQILDMRKAKVMTPAEIDRVVLKNTEIDKTNPVKVGPLVFKLLNKALAEESDIKNRAEREARELTASQMNALEDGSLTAEEVDKNFNELLSFGEDMGRRLADDRDVGSNSKPKKKKRAAAKKARRKNRR